MFLQMDLEQTLHLTVEINGNIFSKNNFCYFIHIPRTGGRYISSLFENSSNIECKYHRIHEHRFDGIDVTHLHYPLYNVFLGVENIPHLTVVRNPYDKFNSCLSNMHKLHGIDYNNILNSYDSFVEFVNLEINLQSYHNNWFLPQNKFISPKHIIGNMNGDLVKNLKNGFSIKQNRDRFNKIEYKDLMEKQKSI